MSSLRIWSDKTGTFKVDAQYLGLESGKVSLHKSNGVKILVPLEKLDAKDIEYINSQRTGFTEKPITFGIPSLPITPTAVNPPKPTLSDLKTDTNFVYNNFDWRNWLITVAKCTPSDSEQYARKFVAEKMDRESLGDLERDLLRSMKVSEGDIIRIRKAVTNGEGKAQERNLMFLQVFVY